MQKRHTDLVHKVLQLANMEAIARNNEYIGTEDLLMGLTKEGNGVGVTVLKILNMDLEKIRRELMRAIPKWPDPSTEELTIQLPLTPRAKRVMKFAEEEVIDLNSSYLGTEHLLLGLMRDHEGVAAQVLMNLGLKYEDVRQVILQLLGSDHLNAPPQKEKPPDIPILVGDEKMGIRQVRPGIYGLEAKNREVLDIELAVNLLREFVAQGHNITGIVMMTAKKK